MLALRIAEIRHVLGAAASTVCIAAIAAVPLPTRAPVDRRRLLLAARLPTTVHLHPSALCRWRSALSNVATHLF